MPKRNYSPAELAARARYNAKAYDAITIRFKKGGLDEVKKAANLAGESLNKYITDAVYRRIFENVL